VAHQQFRADTRVVVGLDDGSWLVGYRGAGETPDWHDFTLNLSTVDWRTLNIDTVTIGEKVDKSDLSSVRSVGFTDLEKGGKSVSRSRLDWIDVFGRVVKK